MTGHASGHSPAYRKHFAKQAQRLADLGVQEEAAARFFGVPVYTIYEWAGTYPEFAEALAEARRKAKAKVASLSADDDPYPACTWVLRFCRETGRPELAVMLEAKMDAMKAIGPEAVAAFNDALWNDVMLTQPGRNIPLRSE